MHTVGIVGGGQLGRMLAVAAARLGLQTIVLEPGEKCPAAQVSSSQITAAYDDPDALDTLAVLSDVITYEFENVPVEAARTLAEKKPVYPPPQALEVSQDRLTEKTFLHDCGIQTAEFTSVDSQEELEKALAAFNGKGVLKTRRLGYDGKGQVLFDDPGQSSAHIYTELGSVPLILESLVPFVAEISVIGARAADGKITCFDPAQNHHREGILRRSIVPADVPERAKDESRAATRKILEKLDYVGVVGVEFFVLADGTIMANELAPRVHNSGHWTQAACAVSQFEQHIRAICGLPLADATRHSDCEMENLIGDEVERLTELLQQPDTVVEIYGKHDVRPGRKMGHFTRLIR
ncbi:MAG: 5-(carboxyamino)imidazole ribonucleotide synthase [Pseudomonadota bacterium]